MRPLFYTNCVFTAVLVALLVYSSHVRSIQSAEIQAATNANSVRARSTVPPRTVGNVMQATPIAPPTINHGNSFAFANHRDALDYINQISIGTDFKYISRLMGDLSPLDHQELLRLLYERSRSAGAVAGLKLPDDDPNVLSAKERLAEIDNAIATFYGNRRDDVLALLDVSGSMIIIGNSISPLMQYADVPLKPDQELRLAALLHSAHFDKYDPLYSGIIHGSAERMASANAEIAKTAATFLSPRQIYALKTYQREIESNISGK